MNDLSKTLKTKFLDKEYRHTYAESFRNSWIAAQIKTIREQREWTQSKLAEEADMKQARISLLEDVNYESWNIMTLRRLARAFDCDLVVKFADFNETLRDIHRFNVEALKVEEFSPISDSDFTTTNISERKPVVSVTADTGQHAYATAAGSTAMYLAVAMPSGTVSIGKKPLLIIPDNYPTERLNVTERTETISTS